MMKKFQPSGRRAIKWKNRRAQYSFIDWRKEKKLRERKKTLNVFYFMIISFIYGLFLLLLFCHTENFIFFLLLLPLLLNWVVFRKQKKTEWINENENKQQRQLRERWVVIFLVKCSGEMGCEKRKHKRHNKMREREKKML